MNKISKTVVAFSLITNLILAITPVKAGDVKNIGVLFQTPMKIFWAMIVDEKGKKIDGAIIRIKGREDEKLSYSNFSHGGFIMWSNYPTNAIMIISKPGYVTQEIKTAGLRQPKNGNGDEIKKCRITIKMVPVKKVGNQPIAKKKKV